MKKNLITIARALIILGLLYVSHTIFLNYTYKILVAIDFDKIYVSMMVHGLLFFLIGVILRFDLKLFDAFKRRTVKVDGLQMGLGILAILVLFILQFRVRLYFFCFIAFLGGYFITGSLEHQTKQMEPFTENSEG